MQSLNWDHLRFFLAVARAGALQGAAKALGVNHSTVFRRVNQLEAQLGSRLFERLPEGYRLTALGEELVGHAEGISEQVDQFQLLAQGKDQQLKGNIRLTAPENIARTFLPRYLSEFRARFAEVTIELVVSGDALNLSRREADVAVRSTHKPPEHLVGRKLMALKWGYFCKPALAERFADVSDPAQLPPSLMIGAEGAVGLLPVFRNAQRPSTDQVAAIRCSSLDGMAALAEAGAGIALLPDDQVSGNLVRLMDVWPAYTSQLWLLTHPELRHVERIRQLMQHLTDCFRHEPRLQGRAIFD